MCPPANLPVPRLQVLKIFGHSAEAVVLPSGITLRIAFALNSAYLGLKFGFSFFFCSLRPCPQISDLHSSIYRSSGTLN